MPIQAGSFLLLGRKKCLGSSYASLPQPGISHFPQKSWFLLMHNDIYCRNHHLGIRHAHWCQGGVALRASQWVELGNQCVYLMWVYSYMYIHTHIYIYIYFYIYLPPYLSKLEFIFIIPNLKPTTQSSFYYPRFSICNFLLLSWICSLIGSEPRLYNVSSITATSTLCRPHLILILLWHLL